MIRIIIIIFTFFSFISNSYSKDEITKYEDLIERGGLFFKKFTDTPFSGKVEGYKDNLTLGKHTFSRGFFKNGKRNGDWEFYFSNGNLKSKGKIHENFRVGKWVFYGDKGLFYGECTYEKGSVINGTEIFYDNSKVSKVLSVNRYSKGKREGRNIFNFNDGSGMTDTISYFKNGKKNDNTFHYYPDTYFLKISSYYKNNQLDGEVTEYWNKKGQYVKFSSMYENGNLVWKKFFNENEHIRKFIKYENENTNRIICEYDGNYGDSYLRNKENTKPTKCYSQIMTSGEIIPQSLNVLDSIMFPVIDIKNFKSRNEYDKIN